MDEKKREIMKNALFASAVVAVAVNAKTTTVHAEEETDRSPKPTETAASEQTAGTESTAEPTTAPSEESTDNQQGNVENEQTETQAKQSVRVRVISDTVIPSSSAESNTGGDTETNAVGHEVVVNNHWKYLKSDGTYATGITNIGYKTVAYDSDGNMLYGLQTIEGKTYYFHPVTGAMEYGEQVINNHWYHFDKNGVMSVGFTDLGNKTVYYGQNGQMLYGLQTIEGKTYYFHPVTGAMEYGEQVINNHWYHFDSDGVMSTGVTDLGYKGVLYNSNGQMLYGENTYDGKTYYSLPVTGEISTGWRYISSAKKTIYSDETGKVLHGYQKIGNTEYYLDDHTGAAYTGWKDVNNKWMYFYGTTGRLPRSGEQAINNHWMYLNEDGSYATGLTNIGYKTVLYNNEGQMLYGKQTFTDQKGKDHTVYLKRVTGELVKDGWYEVDTDGTTYYADNNGYLLSGEQTIEGGTYYFDPNTYEAQYGWIASQNASYTKDGQKLVNLSGKQSIDDKTYYFDETTHTPVTGFHTGTDNQVYYMDSNGLMQFGEKALISPEDQESHWYYFDKKTGAMATGLTNIGYKTVYYDTNGRMQYGEQLIDDNWYYYFKPVTGEMVTGPYYITDSHGHTKWVVYDNDGRMYHHNAIYGGKYYQINSFTGEVIKQSYLAYGIDISEHNGNINLDPYQNGFVIIRAGWGGTGDNGTDKQFWNNVRKCEQLGISYGIYWYGYALNPNDAADEARKALQVIRGTHPTLGVWYDMEDADGWKARHGMSFNNSNITAQVNAFCGALQSAGYKAGVYASESWFNNGWINVGYPKWIANWGNNDGMVHYGDRIANVNNLYVHQYTSHGGLDKDVIYNTTLFA